MYSELESKMMTRRGIRGKSFLDSSPRIAGIEDILENTTKPISYGNLLKKSRIRFKPSFLKYLKFCVEKKLITKTYVNIDNRCEGSFYEITYDGKRYLELML